MPVSYHQMSFFYHPAAKTVRIGSGRNIISRRQILVSGNEDENPKKHDNRQREYLWNDRIVREAISGMLESSERRFEQSSVFRP
jgi:hypothetical protein